MVHLYKHESGKLKGKYDFAFVTNGRHKGSSDGQGFENRMDAIKTMVSVGKDYNSTMFTYQDNTDKIPVHNHINVVSKSISKTGFTVENGLPNKKLKRYVPPISVKKINKAINS